jgi:hypothetical protein
MSLTKNALSRYQVINSCFISREKVYWTMNEILQMLQRNDLIVSKRTVELDIEAMRYDERLGFKAPIEFCRRHRGYYYTDRTYSINSLQLTNEELQSLMTAENLIKPLEGINSLRDFSSAVRKIVGKMNRTLLPGKLRAVPAIQLLKPVPDARITDLINQFHHAIEHKIVVNVFMKPGITDYEPVFFFHPYTLDPYFDAWYIIGLRHTDHILIWIQLNWIQCISPTDIPLVEFEPNSFKNS